jgi:hypothetical protein
LPAQTPPAVTLAAAPVAFAGATATLGTAVAGTGSDPLTARLVSDAAFASGSTLALVGGNLVYTPGPISYGPTGADRVAYTVTDSVTGAVTSETQTVLLSTGAPGPTAASTGPVTLGAGPSSLVLDISQDAWQGDAQFTVSVDGTRIGGVQTATAAHAAGADQAFTVLGDFSAGTNTVSVSFVNDAYAGAPSMDRNLYVDGIASGGVTNDVGAVLLSNGTQSFAFAGITSATVTTAAASFVSNPAATAVTAAAAPVPTLDTAAQLSPVAATPVAMAVPQTPTFGSAGPLVELTNSMTNLPNPSP